MSRLTNKDQVEDTKEMYPFAQVKTVYGFKLLPVITLLLLDGFRYQSPEVSAWTNVTGLGWKPV